MTYNKEHSIRGKKYKIVFSGALKPGWDRLSVISRLAKILGTSGEMIGKLFIGKPVLVKGNLLYDDARSYKTQLEQSGAIFQLLEASEIPPPIQVEKVIVTPPAAVSHTDDNMAGNTTVNTTGNQAAAPNLYSPANDFSFRKVEKKANKAKVVALSAVVILIVYVIGSNIVKFKKINNSNTHSIEPAPASVAALAVQPKHMFRDPGRYYSIKIPLSYTVSNKSDTSRSKITFSYPGGNSLVIMARPMNREWNPEAEMMKKLSAVKEGRAGPLNQLSVTSYRLLNFNGMEGYEIIAQEGDRIAHMYALVSFSGTAFAVAIVTSGRNSRANHDELEKAVRLDLKPN